MRRLLLAYPRAWRERYGEELLELIEADAGGERVPLRVKLDVAVAGITQRLTSAGLAGSETPPERADPRRLCCSSSRPGRPSSSVGIGFAKTAEHWQAVTPPSDQGAPSVSYGAVLLAAGLGTLAVLAGIALTARPLLALVRSGGWRRIHRPVIRAICVTGLTIGVLLAVVAWAHGLTDGQRNGGDLLYSGAVVVLGALRPQCRSSSGRARQS